MASGAPNALPDRNGAIERQTDELPDDSAALSGAVYSSFETLDWKRLYEAVLASTPDLGYVFDLNHCFVYANDALLAMWGRTWEEAIGKTCLELGYEPWHAAMHDREIDQVIVTRKPIRGDVPFNGTNGPRIYDYIFFPVFGGNGEVIAVGGSTRDVTDRKNIEEALRESEERMADDLADLQHLQNISSAMSYEDSPDSLYEKFLEAAVVIMRSDLGSMQKFYPERGGGGELRLLVSRGFSPEAVDLWQWVSNRSQTACGESLRVGARIVVPDVQQCGWLVGTPALQVYLRNGIRAMQTTPLVSRSGKLLGMISTHWHEPHDPSQRTLRSLDILARQAADLIDRWEAEERQKQSDAALRKAEKFAAAGRMAATIAHEINNPLEAIVNLWFLLSQEDGLSSLAQEQLKTLGAELSRVSHITRQTLEFYRDGKTAAPVDLDHPIRTAVALFAQKAARAGTVIEIDNRTSVTVFGFVGELRQVFLNLIGNSLEAGASAIRIRISSTYDWRNRKRPGVRVTIADNGAGIPGDSANKLFQPFFTTKDEKGTGLGLWVSKGIVQKHEGSIHMRTCTHPTRHGTTFTLFLPTL